MPVYQALYHHRADSSRWTVRVIQADSLGAANRFANNQCGRIAAAEQWGVGMAALIRVDWLGSMPPNFARARATAYALADSPAHAERLFRAACVVAGVAP